MGVTRLDSSQTHPSSIQISGKTWSTVPDGQASHWGLTAGWARRATIVLVVALTALALSLRLTRLDASGFSEDELEKFEATRSYAQHQFSADADHPMLMKLGARLPCRGQAQRPGAAEATFERASPPRQ
ncbi:MAG: hypothetical protein ABI051_16355 [Vicinamibacterales bacterium]